MNLSVRRAITIPEYLAKAERPKELAAISLDLAMNKSTMYRFLATLAEAGYIQQELDTGRYTLGSRITWLSAKFLEKMDIRQLARPILEDLARESGQTIHLAILDRDEVVYIDKIDGKQALIMAARVGSRTPVHSTALGIAMLANLPESEWQRYVAEIGWKPRTRNTIVDSEAFLGRLRQVRKQNYAIDAANQDGICCVAPQFKNTQKR